MDQLLAQTSQLLARVTSHAAVVVGPEQQAVVVRAANLVSLQPRVLLAVVVLSNGSVEKDVVVFDHDVTDDDVADASARFARELSGRRLAEVATIAQRETADDPDPDEHVGPIVDAARTALQTRLAGHQNEPLYVGGASRLAAEHDAFLTTNTARLFELLEQHVVLASLMRELLGPGLTVSIGSENTSLDLRECSLVLAPYLVEGELAGTVGVLGPTRMDYRKAQAAVATVSRQLGRQLSP
jgi:heat-inducible transcriptional repressor